MAMYRLGDRDFTSKEAIKKHVQAIFAAYEPGEILSEIHFNFVYDLLNWHPSASQKIGCGISQIAIHIPKPWKAKGFLAIRNDGTTTDFSYKICLNPQLAEHDMKVRDAFRYAIVSQVVALKKEAFRFSSLIVCPVTQQEIDWDSSHVDHHPIPFIDLYEQYLQESGISVKDIVLNPHGDNSALPHELADKRLERDWQRWHHQNAGLRVISASENIRLGAHRRTA